MFSEDHTISNEGSWTGTFQVDSTLGSGTVIAMHFPTGGSFAVFVNGSDGSFTSFTDVGSMENWNQDANLRIATAAISRV